MKAGWLILCAALAWPAAAAAPFVELTARLEITNWQYQVETGLPLRNTRTASVRCVVGTNDWLIEYPPRTNATESFWFVDGKFIRQIQYNDEAPAEETSSFRSYRRNWRPVSIIDGGEGYPAGDLLVNVPWFAYCSGPFLRRTTRGVPVPTSPPDRMAFGFTNETTVFPDRFGLPRRALFYAAPGQVKCQYEVQQFTNVLGWNFPVRFTVVQNEPDSFGKWSQRLFIAGRLTSIRPAAPLELPEDIRERLEYRDQFPRRR